MKNKVEFEEVLVTLENTLHKNCRIKRYYHIHMSEFEEQINYVQKYIVGKWDFEDWGVLGLETKQIVWIADDKCKGVLKDISYSAREMICIEAYRRVCEDLLNNEYV